MHLQSDTPAAVLTGEVTDPEALGARTLAFPDDRGLLEIDTRRVLVQLLLGPSVDARRQTKLWPVLLRDENVVRSRLNDMFLELVIDHEQQVAFTRQAVATDLDAPVLLNVIAGSCVRRVSLCVTVPEAIVAQVLPSFEPSSR